MRVNSKTVNWNILYDIKKTLIALTLITKYFFVKNNINKVIFRVMQDNWFHYERRTDLRSAITPKYKQNKCT